MLSLANTARNNNTATGFNATHTADLEIKRKVMFTSVQAIQEEKRGDSGGIRYREVKPAKIAQFSPSYIARV